MNEQTFSAVQLATAEHFGIQFDSMMSSRRPHNVARVRQIAMWACEKMIDTSLSEIGRRFGRDHTTVAHAIQTIDCHVVEADHWGQAATALLDKLVEGERKAA